MRRFCFLALAAVGIALVVRGFAGPFDQPIGIHSPMNVEGLFALGFLALLFAGSQATTEIPSQDRERWWLPLALAILVTLCFVRYLRFPFVADDYAHVLHGHQASWQAIWAHFTVPEEDRFFRPLGYLSYAADARWAGFTPGTWRWSNLLFHLINTLLLYFLCRRLRFGTTSSFLGALLFGIHASNPEAVTWVSARFDLLAVLFGLISLLCILQENRTAASITMVLAVMSKESAYLIPLLVCALLWFEHRPWQQIWKLTAPLFLLSALVFAYRWYVLGGIGGYHNAANGTATVLNFRFTSTLKALLLRFWAAMLFPLNWTGELGPVTAFALLLAVIALTVLAWKGGMARRPLWLGFLFATLCSLPVHQFLSIGPDLEKSRVLYFASIGLAILFAAISANRRMVLGAGVFLLFQGIALQHNLEIWNRVGQLAARACQAGVTVMQEDHRPLLVLNLPNVVDGVYFLHTGYPECVEMQSGLRPQSSSMPTLPQTLLESNVFAWQDSSRSLQRIQ